MQYRKLGRTQLSVSVIGFGASALGGVFGEVSRSVGQRAVAAAIENGINLFDVSPYYGHTLAEERLGEALSGRRSKVLLGTKCGRYGTNYFDFSAGAVTVKFEQSLRRLKTDYVDLLQVHDIEFGDIDQILNETLPAMEKLRDQGKARFIGITGYWPSLLARVAVRGKVDCVLNYCHANLFAGNMLRELVPDLSAAGIGILNASPLHMGLLGTRLIPEWHPAPPAVRQAAIDVRLLCEQFGVDPGTLALQTCVGMEAIASTFVGMSQETEVYIACEALTWTPQEPLLKAAKAIIEPVYDTFWPSGRVENQDGPSEKGSMLRVDAQHQLSTDRIKG